MDFLTEQCLPCPESECPREKEKFRGRRRFKERERYSERGRNPERERDSETGRERARTEKKRRPSQSHIAVCDLAWEVIVLRILHSLRLAKKLIKAVVKLSS